LHHLGRSRLTGAGLSEGGHCRRVTKQDLLDPQKITRPRDWGTKLAAGIAPSRAQGTRS
jgi:hypothetical protein